MPRAHQIVRAVRLLRNAEIHASELVRDSVDKQHILARGARIAEAVAEIEADHAAVDLSLRRAPVYVTPSLDAIAPYRVTEDK